MGLLLLVLVSNSFCQVSVEVRTNKATYLAGEPVFVILDVTNIGTEAVGYSYCDGRVDLTVDKAEKKHRPNLRGCFAAMAGGGYGCGIDHPPMMAPNESISFQYLLKDYRLGAGNYVLRAKGKTGVRWKYYPNMGLNPPPAPPPQHKEDNPVPGASFDASLPIVLTSATEAELQLAYGPYISDAEGFGIATADMWRAREAIAEMAPEFLEKTIAGFATGPVKTPNLAATGLGQIDTPESRADLMKLYDESTDLNLRNQIVGALAGIATSEQLAFFAELLAGRSTAIEGRIQQWAALGLGRVGGDEAAHALAAGLSNPNAHVRRDVALALGNTRLHAAVPLLIDMYSDKDNDVTNAVCGALTELTHHAWCDGSGADVRVQQARWLRWWRANGIRVTLYGSDQCPERNANLPLVH